MERRARAAEAASTEKGGGGEGGQGVVEGDEEEEVEEVEVGSLEDDENSFGSPRGLPSVAATARNPEVRISPASRRVEEEDERASRTKAREDEAIIA